MLSSASVEVTSVMTGSEALQHIAKASFDLCCLDIHLPDVNGMEIMKTIRDIAPQTKIIMMTGGDVTSPMLKEIRKNSELLLSKPFDLFKVKMFVEGILSGKPADTVHAGNYKAFEYRLMNDQRRHERHPVAKRIAYTPVSGQQEQEQTAEIVDISDGGMCLVTTYLMPRGVVLRICNNKTDHCAGTVRWSMQTGSDDLYRTGIQLMQTGDGDVPS